MVKLDEDIINASKLKFLSRLSQTRAVVEKRLGGRRGWARHDSYYISFEHGYVALLDQSVDCQHRFLGMVYAL